MECPNCGGNFVPHMERRSMGKNIKGNNVFVYFQLCSKCYEPVVGLKEGNNHKQWFEPTDTEGLVILKQSPTNLFERGTIPLLMYDLCYTCPLAFSKMPSIATIYDQLAFLLQPWIAAYELKGEFRVILDCN